MVLASRREFVCMYVGIYSASLYIYIYNYISVAISHAVTPQLCKSHRSWNPFFAKSS